MPATVQLTLPLLSRGAAWLAQWSQIPSPAPLYFVKPPQGAAGEAVIAAAYTAELAGVVAILAAKRDSGEITPEQLSAALGNISWKELGGADMLKAAAGLPDKYRGVLAYMLYMRGQMRALYNAQRPARANTAWSPTAAPPDNWQGDFLAQMGASTVSSSPTLAAVTIVGIVGLCAAAWYGSKRADAGVALEAERVHSLAQAWRDVQIAAIAAANGQDIQVPAFVARGAQIEAATSSPWAIGIVAGVAGLGTGAALWAGLSKKKRRNPSRRRQVKGTPRERFIRSQMAKGRTEKQAGATWKAIQGAKKKATTKKARRKTTKRKATKRKTTRRKANPPTKRKATKRKATKRKTTKRKATKRKTTKRKTNPSQTPRAKFIRSQMAKGRSEKQAGATWKAIRASKKKRAKKTRARRARKNR